MKFIILSFFFALSSHAACEKVSTACVTEVKLSADTKAFLKAEVDLGKNIYDLNHVNKLKVYQGAGLVNFGSRFASAKELLELGQWATAKLGVYETMDYDSVDMFRSLEKLNKAKFQKLMKNKFIDMEEHLKRVAEGYGDKLSAAQEKLSQKRLSLMKKALSELEDLIFLDSDEVEVYDLLDNNNENVQDAQVVIVGRKSLMIINRFWYL